MQAAQDQLVPLMSEAAFKGDVATMERLVAKGASVNQHDQVCARVCVCVCVCVRLCVFSATMKQRAANT
jgi:hypothetical protein